MVFLAESANPVSFQWMPAVTTLAVFLIFFFILQKKVWPQIMKGLDERQLKIRREIEAAEEAREKANAALAEYEQSLAAARKEAAETIANARAEAKAVAAELRARSEVELQEKMDRANRDIDTARRAAVAELHAEAANLAASIAAKILQREISAEDQQQLMEQSLHELASTGKN